MSSKIDVASYLRSVSLIDVLMIAKLSSEERDDRSFAIELLTQKLKDVNIYYEEIEQLTDEDLREILVDWFTTTGSISEDIRVCLSLEQVVDLLREYAPLQLDSHRALAELIPRSFGSSEGIVFKGLEDVVSGNLIEQFRQINSAIVLNQLEPFRTIVQDIPRLSALHSNVAISSIMDGIESAMRSQLDQANMMNLTSVSSLLRGENNPTLSAFSQSISQIASLYPTADSVVMSAASQMIDANVLSSTRNLLSAAQSTILAEASLAKIGNWSSIGSIMNSGIGIDGFAKALTPLVNSYADYLTGYSALSGISYVQVPDLIGITSLEYFSSSDVAEVITVKSEEDEITQRKRERRTELYEENDVAVRLLLDNLNDGLVKMMDGANHALSSDNPDKTRHFSTSWREMFTHILHMLASDEEILAWNGAPELYHNGNPTRKARLLFICRHINHPPLEKFFEKDIQATLELIDFLNKATHNVEMHLSPDQSLALKLKVEGAVRFVLEISKHRIETRLQ